MYVSTGVARTNHFSGLGRLRRRLGRRLGDDFTASLPFLSTVVNDAATVAKVAVSPTPSTSIIYPGGATVTASGGAALPALSASSLGVGSIPSSYLLLGGFALLLVVVMSARK